MKILRLKALNINSLKGETSIDFEDFLQDGALFAITGPTGSGKTTILDIITCALYGKTPRLDNPNDLMSKYCGEALCEVEFEVKDKVYRSSWNQRRARGKADGAFQQSTMQLALVETQELLESKKSKVPKVIEELTGLDFARFSQSMMLAQGGFDAFLKAKEGERSALLEKMTGTKIYTEISKKVYETHGAFLQEIKDLQRDLENIERLDDETLALKQNEVKELTLQSKKESLELEGFTKQLTWVETLEKLTLENSKHTTAFEKASKEKELNREAFEKVVLDQKAVSVQPFFIRLQNLQNSIESDENKSKELREILDALLVSIEAQRKAHSQGLQTFGEAEETFNANTQKLQQARSIETQEKAFAKQLEGKVLSIEAKVKEQTKVEVSYKQVSKAFEVTQTQVKQAEYFLEQNKADEPLANDIALLQQHVQTLSQEQERLNTTEHKTKVLLTELEELSTKVDTSQETLKLQESRTQQSLQAYENLEQQSTNDLQDEQTCHTQAKALEHLQAQYEVYQKLVKEKIQEEESLETQVQNKVHIEERVKNSQLQLLTLQKLLDTLRAKKESDLRLAKYENDRAGLTEGEACALCGSIHHPYAVDAPLAKPDETQQEIEQQELVLASHQKKLTQEQSERTKVETTIQSSHLEIEKLDASLVPITALFKQHDFKPDHEHALGLGESLDSFQQKLQAIQKRRESKNLLLKERDRENKTFSQMQEAYNTLKSKHTLVENELKQLHGSKQGVEEQIKLLISSLQKEWEKYGLSFDLQAFNQQFQVLEERNTTYQTTLVSKTNLEVTLQQQALQKQELNLALQTLQDRLLEEQKEQTNLQQNRQKLLEERNSILSVPNLDLFETEIQKAYKNEQTKLQNLAQQLEHSQTKQVLHDKQHKALLEQIELSKTMLVSSKSTFDKKLKEQGFKKLEEFEEALLKQNKRVELDTKCKSIEANFQQAQTLKIQTSKQLLEHTKETLSAKTIEQLQSKIETLKEQLKLVNTRLVQEQTLLEVDQKNKEKSNEKLKVVEEKQERFKVWAKLQELIGSANGNKFAQFAQGITLDQLIQLANQHLDLLNTRYELIRSQDEKQQLEIEVIDTYQGNVIRPVSTLSGGESFIVSLALALGLSELASQKININSLFLDEGFGTLDEQSLEMALEALNRLQDSGKMVGIISHVEALKERIPLQIKVLPRGDGVSFVEIGD